jgi:hypothetical protein
MSDNSNAFIATVFYRDHDGAEHTIVAVVLAVDEMDAVQTAIGTVAALPHCAKVDAGIIEPVPEPAADAPNARPAGATVH